MRQPLKAATARDSILLLLIAALAAYLRLGGLDNPGWFSDEGTHLSIAHNLLLGRDQYLAVGGSVLLFSRLPVFEWLLAAALTLAGAGPGGDPARGMAVLRALTGGLGVATTIGVYAVARRSDTPAHPHVHTSTPALLAALAYALYPPAIIYSRLGFSYNLLAPLVLGVVWAAGNYLQAEPDSRRWLMWAAGLAGLGTLVDLWAWVLLPVLAGVVLLRWRAALCPAARDLALAALVAGVPFALYALRQLLAVPDAFLFDLRFVLGRLGALSPVDQARAVAENLSVLAAQDGWLALGLLGLFALRPARRAGLALLFVLLPLLLLGRTTALYSLGFYYLIPLLPFVALGLGGLAAQVGEHGAGWARVGLGALGGLLLVGALWLNLGRVRDGFVTAIDPFLLNPADARAAAAWLAQRRDPDELVLASPALAWLLPGQAADFQMALAFAGQLTPHVPPSLPRDRYLYDPHPDQARYVVVDNLWRNWGVFHAPGLGALLSEVAAWPVTFQAGEIVIYQRP